MAKVTWPYIEQQFYLRFARLTRPEQHGIIAGLRAITLSGTCGEPELHVDQRIEIASGDLFEEEANAKS